MDRIGTNNLIWEWKGIDFDTFAYALYYYELAIGSKIKGYGVEDFLPEQVKHLACRCYAPHGHSEGLTPEILGAMGWQTYITVKKKLYAELPWQEMYEQCIFASEELGKSIPSDMKDSVEEK